jgi:hypothetical protein
LEAGSEEKIHVSKEPVQFIGQVSYNIPDKNTLEDEAEISDINDLNELEEEMIEEADSE